MRTYQRFLLFAALGLWIIALAPIISKNIFKPAKRQQGFVNVTIGKSMPQADIRLKSGLALLRVRKDKEALAVFDKILEINPDQAEALWGKAEILRRSREFRASELLLNKVLKNNPYHPASLITLSYIRYMDNKLAESLKLTDRALKIKGLNKDNQALANLMLGYINSKRATAGGFLRKLAYGTRIKGYFIKARELAPDLPEVHLGLGSFYLLAPAIAGGNLNSAIKELEFSLSLAPDFATANARLAQAYKINGDLVKYAYYYNKAKSIDPGNEALRE